MSLELVLFDLDGTLADTAADIARATNLALAEAGRSPLSVEHVRGLVSQGARRVLEAGYAPGEVEEATIDRLVERLFAHYAERPADETHVFDGLGAMVAELAQLGIRWGVVSNKPVALVEPIVAALGLQPDPVCTLGGDSTPRKKPDPLPLLHACELAGVAAERALYVGDAEIDVRAARAADMPVAIAGFGYAPESAAFDEWAPDCYATSVDELQRFALSLHRDAFKA